MKEIDLNKIKPAPYNPRKITEHHYNGLKNSMDKFGDISGITWNQKTKNLVAGHHRWDKLKNQYSDLHLSHSHEDKWAINSKEQGYTGFDMRIVEWDEATERAANITANNHAISGEWDLEILHTLVEEIKTTDGDMFKNLNMDILESDLKLDFNEEWNSDIADGVGGVSENLDGLKARIIIECEGDMKDEVLIYIKAKLMETSFEGVHVK